MLANICKPVRPCRGARLVREYREILRHDPRGVAKVIRALRPPSRCRRRRHGRDRVTPRILPSIGVPRPIAIVEAANKTLAEGIVGSCSRARLRAWKALIAASDTVGRQHQPTCSSHCNRCLNSARLAPARAVLSAPVSAIKPGCSYGYLHVSNITFNASLIPA